MSPVGGAPLLVKVAELHCELETIGFAGLGGAIVTVTEMLLLFVLQHP